jgi:Uncharacterized protein conserved in bacteria
MKLKFKLPNLSKLSDIKLPSLPLDLKKVESFDKEHYRIIAYGLGGVIVLMVVAGLSAFLLSLRGTEQTMVPDLRKMELAPALIKLQEKELYPRVSLRFTDNPLEEGTIVEQSPAPGTIVKAGRRIAVTVSRGSVVKKVENFVGQDINEVKIHLQSLFAGTKTLLSVKEPPVYVYDKAPMGTVLEQKPLPETPIGGATQLELVVSRGPENAQVKVPDLMGLSIDDALRQIHAVNFEAKTNLVVDFAMRPASKTERSGVVVSETPASGSIIAANARVSITMTTPHLASGTVAGVFSRDLPEYPYPLKVTLDAVTPSGSRSNVFTVNHPGGHFTAPYVLPEGDFLELTVLDRPDQTRQEVTATKAP